MIIGLIIMGVAVFNYLAILANKFHRKTKEFYLRTNKRQFSVKPDFQVSY